MAKGHQVVLNPRSRVKRKVVISMTMIAGLLWGGWALFDYGRYRAGFDSEAALKQESMLELRIQSLSEEGQRLRERIAILEHGKEIDQAAYIAVEKDLKLLQDEVGELEQQLTFYQNIVSPADIKSGARVQSIRFEAQADAGVYLYKLILIQGPKRANRATGRVKVSFQGMKAGQDAILSMHDLHIGNAVSGKYRFKYFQEFQGSIRLPEDFMPANVLVELKPDGKKSKIIEEQYSWETVKN